MRTLIALLGLVFITSGCAPIHNHDSRDMPAPGNSLADNEFFVTFNPSATIRELSDVGSYDWINDKEMLFSPANSFYKIKRAADVKLHLVNLGYPASTQEVELFLSAQGFKPAMSEYLLAAGARYPEKQRGFPIFALGSYWTEYEDGVPRRRILGLVGDEGARGLYLVSANVTWPSNCRFLALEDK